MLRFSMAILLIVGILAGYRLYHQLTSPNLSAQAVADSVGAVYGDVHPRVVRVISTTSEGDGAAMYVLTITGHFRNGAKRARYLLFSALANRRLAWGLWAGNVPPSHTARRVWFADSVPLDGQKT